jgi:predicted ATP-dependent serine protease
MIKLTGSKKEQAVRQWINDNMEGVIPAKTKVIDVFRKFEQDHTDISYGCLNGTMKKIMQEGHITTESHVTVNTTGEVNAPVEPAEPLDINIVAVEDMEFPNFALHNTGKKLDELLSDHEEGGGLYGGTVNIVVGESGVGKSTILLDMLAAVQEQNPDAKVLYVSSEMTRNDIKFYHQKTPSIGRVPTLLLMDYVKSGRLDEVIEQTLNKDYDIILIDSHQDVLVKLKEIKGWRSTFAESWLTNLMIDAAEKNGSAILAIQHMTKGGQYVGSTYLKHATTSMMEIMFDDTGNRYVKFSKNRRGGSAVGKRLYFNLVDGEVVYDTARFNETEELRDIEQKESSRQIDLSAKFDEIFLGGEAKAAQEDADKEDAVEDVELEIVNEDTLPGLATVNFVREDN